MGNCGFPHIDFNQAIGDVNYFVSAAYRGQGLATEALFALCAFGFDNLKLTRIRGQCSPENMSSERVMRKVGRSLKRGDGLVRV